jgi:hypothetical protein
MYVAGSVRLYQDPTAASTGLYQAGDVLVQGGRTFDASGSVTFTNLSGLVTLSSGAPETLMLVFDLKASGIVNKQFQSEMNTATVKAYGVSGQPAIVTGGTLAGNTHTVNASTPTPTWTSTLTFTSTPTPTPTATSTNTFTSTPTATPTPTSTDEHIHFHVYLVVYTHLDLDEHPDGYADLYFNTYADGDEHVHDDVYSDAYGDGGVGGGVQQPAFVADLRFRPGKCFVDGSGADGGGR